MTSGTPQKHQKNLNGTKPMLVNMVKAITTRSKTRNTTFVEGAEKEPPLRMDINTDNTPRTEVSKEIASNNCKENSRDTSVKEMQSMDPFCKCIMKRLLNKTAPKHELDTFFIHNGLLYRYASDHAKDFCALVIPKAWRYTVLVETHNKMGHQGNNGMYSLIRDSIIGRGWQRM